MNTKNSKLATPSGWVYPPTIDYVRQFHRTYEQPIEIGPIVPVFEQRKLQINLILEELEEFTLSSDITSPAINQAFEQLKACINRVPSNAGECANIVFAADALADLDYVVAGGNLVWGIPAERVMAEVHRSNMSKLGADGKPMKRPDGKVIKGPGFFEPDIGKIIFGGDEK